MCEGLAGVLTVCDTKPGLAVAFAEELQHVAVSLGLDVEINACEKDDEVAGADIILISAGEPRTPGVKMSRRDLAVQNAKIVRSIAETTAPKNPSAKYIVITNPVDAMAMICKRYSRADFVISTGTNLESMRFLSKLARTLDVPVSRVRGWVGGEHGEAAITLWSTTKIEGLPVDEYVESEGKVLEKAEVDSYIRSVSKFIIDHIGGTEYGPAASFRDIVRAIAKDTNEFLSVAVPMRFQELPEPVHVSVPVKLGLSIGSSLYNSLSGKEKKGIEVAAGAIFETYQAASQMLE